MVSTLQRTEENDNISSFIIGILLLIIVLISTSIFSINDIKKLNQYGLPDEDSFYVKIFNEFIEENKQINDTFTNSNENIIEYNNNNTIENELKIQPIFTERFFNQSIYHFYSSSIIKFIVNNKINIFKRNDENFINKSNNENDDDDDDEEEEEDDWDKDEEKEEFDKDIFFKSFYSLTMKNILITTIISYFYLILVRL